ncbi:septum formation initiator family protein [Brevibacillus humidisoli]|uniref:FtsB family cell division protein n=1 Tax=Brevibacillus humidisoli TaxID=2895522 RepID=UPI001E44422D|nr:septum formation initiator family protein [Brevibacillus humidisoli]UFJ40551.1 septum formation initiator family protein [Brevibacillus humidisoli]
MRHSPSQSNRQGQKRRIRFFLFLMLFFSIWTGYTAYLQSSALAEKEQQLHELEQKVATMRQTNNELQYKMNRLHDKEYIAELARKKYSLAKPGEVLFILPE